jgi:hypothetical protein
MARFDNRLANRLRADAAMRFSDRRGFDLNLRLPAQRSGDVFVLNKFGSSGQGEAKVQYLDGDFRVISPGAYVRCAVTGTRIPLEDLKYWSVDLQEAYATPEAVLERHKLGTLRAG